MSICQDITSPIPSLPFPFIALPSPTVAINIGTPGVTCCSYTIPGFQFNYQVPIPGIAEALIPFLAALNTTMEAAYAALDSFHIPVCTL